MSCGHSRYNINKWKEDALNQRVLVTDDDPMLQNLYKSMLKNTSGFLSIDFASTKSEALEHLNSTIYDFALLDINLGETEHDGFDILKTINANYKHTKVMMMSSMQPEKVEPTCKLLGAKGFTLKNQDLIQNLRKWLTLAVAENCFQHRYQA